MNALPDLETLAKAIAGQIPLELDIARELPLDDVDNETAARYHEWHDNAVAEVLSTTCADSATIRTLIPLLDGERPLWQSLLLCAAMRLENAERNRRLDRH